jgi:hypothetical protein
MQEDEMASIIVMAGDSLGEHVLEDCWQWCSELASHLGEPVLLATITEDRVPMHEFVFPPGLVGHGELVPPGSAAATAHHHHRAH